MEWREGGGRLLWEVGGLAHALSLCEKLAHKAAGSIRNTVSLLLFCSSQHMSRHCLTLTPRRMASWAFAEETSSMSWITQIPIGGRGPATGRPACFLAITSPQ